MKILKAVRRFSSWICGLFRKKPVYVPRSLLIAESVTHHGPVSVGGMGNTNEGSNATPNATDGLCFTLPPMSRAQAEYMFGRENLKEIEG